MSTVASAHDVDELDRQVQRGSQFTLAILHRSAQRLGRAEALLGGVLDVLQARKGLVTADDLDAALAAAADDDIDDLVEPDDGPRDGPDDGSMTTGPADGVDDEPLVSGPVVGWP